MAQIRHNVILNLASTAKDDPHSCAQLLELLGREDIAVPNDVFTKTMEASQSKIGFVKITRPVIETFNPKPALEGYRPREVWIYFKRYVHYVIVAALIKGLPDALKFETETRAFIVADPQGPDERSLQ